MKEGNGEAHIKRRRKRKTENLSEFGIQFSRSYVCMCVKTNGRPIALTMRKKNPRANQRHIRQLYQIFLFVNFVATQTYPNAVGNPVILMSLLK